jgi:hypothetical protein
MAYEPPDEVGESHVKISDAKNYLRRFSYGQLEGLGTVDTSDLITPGFERAFRQYRTNIHFDFIRGRRPAGMPDLDPANPDFNWAAQKNMGLLVSTAPPPGVPPYYGLSWTGTWGAHDNGYGWHTLRRAKERNPGKLDIQGLGFNTDAFMIGRDPAHSYIDMIHDGVGEGRRFAIPDRRKKIFTGYSGGAGCVVEMLRQWPADRRHEIAIILQFGDPNRPPGRTLLGNDPGGHGISEDFPPDWCLDRYYSFTLPGDMYPNAVGLLPIFYDVLTRMEASLEFMMYLFSMMVDQLGNLTPFGLMGLGLGGNSAIPGFGMLAGLLPLITGSGGGGLLGGLGGFGSLLGGAPQTSSDAVVNGQPINLVAMLFNIPAIISTLGALLQFLITGAHGNYHLGTAFDGMSAEDKAIELILALP